MLLDISGPTNLLELNYPVKYIPTAHLLIFLGAKSLDLSTQVEHFKKLCTGWEKYDDELNYLNIIHTRK